MLNLNKRPIREEYKLWIYKHYLAPSLNFHLAINVISQSKLSKLEAFATKMIKKWLNLPRCATRAILYHTKVLNCPQLSFLYSKTSLGYLVAIEGSTDIVVSELTPLLDSPTTQKHLGFPPSCFNILEEGRRSVSTIPSLKRHCRKSMADLQDNHWNQQLSTLSVQSKFSNVVSLESASFLLKAGSDTLPTAMNLRRMKIQCDSRCQLCQNLRPTTSHILSSCSEALSQGRYTWRHDSVLKCLCNSLKGFLDQSVVMYADIPGHRFDDAPPSTIPHSLAITPLRPDMVIVSELDRTVQVLELTVPNNTPENLQQARHRKQNKSEYLSLFEDISGRGWSVTYDTVEIGLLGHYQKDTIDAIKSILPSVSSDSRAATSQAHKVLLSASKTAMLCSRSIILAHKCLNWNTEKPLLYIATLLSLV